MFQVNGKFRHEIIADEIDNGDVAQSRVGAERHFEVGDFRPLGLEAGLHFFRKELLNVVGIKRMGCTHYQGGIEPTEESLALGVDVVINIDRTADELL